MPTHINKKALYMGVWCAAYTHNGVDRICKMLARQGAAIGTLYELTWAALPDDENARRAFEAAANTAKQKMHRHVEKDEEELATRTLTKDWKAYHR